MKRYFIAFFLIIFLSLSVLSKAVSVPNISGPSAVYEVAEAQDYATTKFADPWDMRRRSDIGPLIRGFSSFSFTNGLFSARTNSSDGNIWLVWGGYPGSYATWREGVRQPITASFYKRFTIKMYSSKAGTAQIYWFNRRDMKDPKMFQFSVSASWRIYQVDLPGNWSGKVTGLRFDPVNKSDATVRIDWARLTNKPGTSVNLTWSDTEAGSGTVYVDSDRSDYNGSVLKTVSSQDGSNSSTVDTDGLEPGNYYFYIQKGGNSNYSSGGVSVNKAPMVSIKNPDEVGNNKTWAGMYVKNPWDMHSGSDIIKYFNISRRYFRRGIFSGVNSRPRPGDAHFYLNMGRRVINTSRFHRLTFRYKYSGKFSLRRGTMSRFGWTTLGTRNWQISDDIVTYTGWNTITVDLKRIRLNRGSYGWRGWANRFRFDPHEDGYSRRFYIDYIHLREDDRLITSFPITFYLDDTNDSSDNLEIYRDRDRGFGNGNEALIASLTRSRGYNSYTWRPSSAIRGTYWIYIKASDDLQNAGFYSTGPLRVH